MNPTLHAEMRVTRHLIGNERSPLLVIDNFVADPDELVRHAAAMPLAQDKGYFPGQRVAAPIAYQQFLATRLRDTLFEFFQLRGSIFRFPMCHYSLVTTSPQKLVMLQRIPHFDSLDGNGLATIHYLFKRDLGGTAFYRHRKTGFETIDAARREAYIRALEAENDGPNLPAANYIHGDTPLFEQIAKQDGVFNRLLVYRRNCLHSGNIAADFVPDPNPLTGRLSINSFIDIS